LNLSVVICSHNPRPDYLARVLAALQAQTLPLADWELLLIDNASAEPLEGRFDLSWHPNARHVREEVLGLTPARLRGIAEAASPLLVFVDDDNVLSSDYLAQVVSFEQTPWLIAPSLAPYADAISRQCRCLRPTSFASPTQQIRFTGQAHSDPDPRCSARKSRSLRTSRLAVRF
jgi:glycosyltransferase involved in cell wall biosynthesis